MYLVNLTAAELVKAHDAADYLLSLPVRLDPELGIKLDTFRADATAALEDQGQAHLAVRRAATATPE